ncbi:MAG: TrbG/VirB9 family P-type conjugative transfer protein [Sphingomonas sp.]|jgi:type IV secretion system protein VirB9
MKAVVLAIAILAAPCLAEISPRPGPGDLHIQSVVYDPEQVVALRVAPGYTLTIELSPDEHIENVSIGDGGAWQVVPNKRADRLFIKSQGNPPKTNLTVITDVRRYNFTLYGASADDPAFPYSVRFTYTATTLAPQTVLDVEPTSYRLKGNQALWPTAISDDGQFTSIIWPTDTAIPAIYLVDARGRESLVNGMVRDGAYVIEGVAPRVNFKLGKASASAIRQTLEAQRK